ncbi:EamA family transporter [Microbacterium sp. C7(2022)]|uniref:EamA family transporter n=1 Tax=Microbacterium sp. C7(2022) TaxID=2992759 RepID=UPI00237AE79C|nr:EamA family transporter [Microbacterium sp. C7(2022)]MDE0545915.1 EamA family transporter [Microbacterium sp. C7(2022)]
MIPATLALVGALTYGAADFLGGLSARRLRSIVVTSLAAFAGLLAFLLLHLAWGGSWSAADTLWGIGAGLVGVVALMLLYACLAIGPMSILSPLTAVVSAIAPMLWGLLAKGETLSLVGYAGLGIALVAVVLVGFIPGEKVVRPSLRGVIMAIGSGVAIGGFLIILDHTSPSSGFTPLIAGRATSTLVTGAIVAVMVLVALRRDGAASRAIDASPIPLGGTPTGHGDVEHATQTLSVRITRQRAVILAVGCGVLDAAANALLLIALRTGDLTVVSALTALYPGGTILLAGVVLRERVAGIQWLGLVLALLAGGMLALA